MLGALRGAWERREQFEATLHMGNGFSIGGALERLRASLLPVAHGLGVAPSFGIVVRQKLGLGSDGLWKLGFEQLRHLLVVLLPGAFQQGSIGGILDERVLEDVAGAGWPAPLIEEFGVHELGQPVLQGGLVHGGERVQEFIRKLPAQHGPKLRHLAHRWQPIQAGHERVVHSSGNGYRSQRAGQRIVLDFLPQERRFQEHFG